MQVDFIKDFKSWSLFLQSRIAITLAYFTTFDIKDFYLEEKSVSPEHAEAVVGQIMTGRLLQKRVSDALDGPQSTYIA